VAEADVDARVPRDQRAQIRQADRVLRAVDVLLGELIR
jgi:hypothetical protein